MRLTMRRAALAALALFAVSGAAQAAEPQTTVVVPGGNGEIFTMAVPSGWTRGASGIEGNDTSVSWFQGGANDSVDSVMMVGRIGGLGGSDPAEFIRRNVEALKSQCDDVVAGDIRPDKASGTVRTAIGCTRRKSNGVGELQLLHIVVGREALYVARRFWKLPAYDKTHVPLSNEAIAAGGADIDGIRVCVLSGAGTPCPAGLAAALKDKVTDLSPL
ncbi:MAG TPA: hypothetical protein VK597_10190, partial [Inquilinus sp.]|nr:hypothetical protein [Inquilinus sp.]